jgi:hypothetical protein
MPRRPTKPDDLDDLLDDTDDEDLVDDFPDDDDTEDGDDVLPESLDLVAEAGEEDLADDVFVDDESLDEGGDWGAAPADEDDSPLEDDPTGEIDADEWPAETGDGEVVEFDIPEVVLVWSGQADLPELGLRRPYVLSTADPGSRWEGCTEPRRALVEIGPIRARVDFAPGGEGPERLVLGRDLLAGRVLVRVARDQAGSGSDGD